MEPAGTPSTGAVACAQAHRRLVAVERELALVLFDDRVFHREQRDRLCPLLELFVELTCLVDGERVGRIDLGDALPVFGCAIFAPELGVGPQPTELFVDGDEPRLQIRLRAEHRPEELHELLEQRHERLRLAALTVELRQAISGRR